MATNPVEVVWPTHVKPMLGSRLRRIRSSVSLPPPTSFAIAFGASLSAHINRLFKRKHTITLVAVFALMAAVQIALALQGNIFGFVAIFILYSIVIGIIRNTCQHHPARLRERSPALDIAVVALTHSTTRRSSGPRHGRRNRGGLFHPHSMDARRSVSCGRCGHDWGVSYAGYWRKSLAEPLKLFANMGWVALTC